MNRIEALERAKSLSLAGEYKEGLTLVDSLLKQNPRDIESLRLKGSLLELQILEREANHPGKHVYSADFGKARACYEQVLLIQPDHPGALTDLGTHWKNLGDYRKALSYFDRALLLYRRAEEAHHDELVEAIEGKAEILRQQGDVESASRLIEELESFKGRKQ